MPRTRANQTKHDIVVEQEANKYLRSGWNVSADIPEWPRPDTINKYRPDIIAQKGKRIEIVEVETEDSVASTKDLLQQSAFNSWANRSRYRHYRRIIAR